MEDDVRWISVSRVNSREDSDKLIDLYFKLKDTKRIKFRLIDFLEDGEYINHYLLENKKMFNYIFINLHNTTLVAKHIKCLCRNRKIFFCKNNV